MCFTAPEGIVALHQMLIAQRNRENHVSFQTVHTGGNNIGESPTTSHFDASDDEDHRNEREFVPMFFNTWRRRSTTRRRSTVNTTTLRPSMRASMAARANNDATPATTNRIVELQDTGMGEGHCHGLERHVQERAQENDGTASALELTMSSWRFGRAQTDLDTRTGVEPGDNVSFANPERRTQQDIESTERLRSLRSVQTA